MIVIAMVSQKGGVGKTTIALNLAVEASAAGYPTVLVDLDPQVSAFHWSDMRDAETPVVIAPPVPHLSRALQAAEADGVRLAIIDTAGRTNDAAAAAVKAADLVLVPLKPSLIDLKTMDSTLDIIRLSGTRPAQAVLTMVKPFGSRHDETAAWLQAQKVDVCPITVGERVAYQDAYSHGLSVTEADPSGKAADEVRALFQHVGKLAGLTSGKPARGQRGKEGRKQSGGAAG